MIEISKLSNGMHVITDTVKEVETVSIGVWCKVGARYEPLKITGISHLLEHMSFKGTTSRSARQMAEEIENVGGYMNAYTGLEATAYYFRLLKEDAKLGIDILADILQNSIMDEKELEREKQVVLQEIGRTYDSPDDIIFDYFGSIAYQDQPFGRPVLGTKESVLSITSQNLKDYIYNEYTAGRLVLSVSGNIEHEKVMSFAENAFSKLKVEEKTLPQKAAYSGGVFVDKRAIEQENLLIGFEGVSNQDERAMTQKVLSLILGGGMSSRLFYEIREKRGLVYSIFSFAATYLDTGYLGIYAGTGKEQTKELLSVLKDEIVKFPSTITEEEILRAKNQLKAQFLMKLEKTFSRCERNAKSFLNYGKIQTNEEVLKEIEAVSLADLQNLSYTLFSSKPTLVGVGPNETLPNLEEIAPAFK